MSISSTHTLLVSKDGVYGPIAGSVLNDPAAYLSLRQGADIIHMTPAQARELVVDLDELMTLEGI